MTLQALSFAREYRVMVELSPKKLVRTSSSNPVHPKNPVHRVQNSEEANNNDNPLPVLKTIKSGQGKIFEHDLKD